MNRLSSLASSDSSPPPASAKMHAEETHHPELGDASQSEVSEQAVPRGSHLLKPLGRPFNRPRTLFLPVRYEASYRYPLVVWLHSDGYNEQQVSYVMPHISTRNYIGVGIRGSKAMDATGRRFLWQHSAAAIARCEDAIWQAVDDVSERYSVHSQRIFLAGYGAGGTMARRIALQRSSQFAGCISIGGRLPRGEAVFSDLVAARRLRNLWAVAMHSQQFSDEQFDEDIRLAAAAKLCMDVRRYTVADEMVTEVLRDVNVWMMRIVTGEPAEPSTPDWSSSPVGFSAN